MRTFTYSDAKSHKFWNIELQGSAFTVTYGRVGTKGQTQTKRFADAARPQKEHDKLIKDKLAKGYVETTPAARTPAASLHESLEAALSENPDDLASHMAYADYLQEQGDPRGEFIQVQLSLEDPSKSAAERKKLHKREKALLDAHQRDWLGELAPFLLENEGIGEHGFYHERVCRDFRFARGWLDTLHLEYLPFELARLLGRSPRTRLLRDLRVEDDARPDDVEDRGGVVIPDREYHAGLCALARSPALPNLRVFALGVDQGEDYHAFNCLIHTRTVLALVRQMPRLEELYLWTNEYDLDALFKMPTLEHLRVLKVYHQDVPHRLELLANNALKRLTHLLFHPHYWEDGVRGEEVEPEVQEEQAYLTLEGVRALVRSKNLPSLTHLQLRVCSMGDKGCKEIVRSGILKRLTSLDLRHGRITDQGAEVLAGCPDLGHLEYLDVERNGLTRRGIQRLKAVGIKQLRASNQMTTQEALDGQYLFEGDFE